MMILKVCLSFLHWHSKIQLLNKKTPNNHVCNTSIFTQGNSSLWRCWTGRGRLSTTWWRKQQTVAAARVRLTSCWWSRTWTTIRLTSPPATMRSPSLTTQPSAPRLLSYMLRTQTLVGCVFNAVDLPHKRTFYSFSQSELVLITTLYQHSSTP